MLHCITRVRFYLKDQSLADDAAVADTEGVIDVAKAGGQYQVVIGPAVEDVYDAVVKQLPGTARGDADGGEVEEVERPTTLIGWLKLGFSSMIGVITGSMIPVIGLLAASGVLKGILSPAHPVRHRGGGDVHLQDHRCDVLLGVLLPAHHHRIHRGAAPGLGSHRRGHHRRGPVLSPA